MAQLVAFVERNPGCSMLAAAEHVGPHRSRQFGYRTAHRAVARMLVHAICGAGRYRLYPIIENPEAT
jgi:hypothetical protein